jgi:hypothetical protein
MLAALVAVLVALSLPTLAGASTVSPRDLVPLLTRNGVAPDLTIIDVIYAPPLFFEATGLPAPPEMDEQPTLAFMFQETIHDGELPLEVPPAFLLLPGGERIAPYDARVTTEDDHHRVSRLLYPAPDDWMEAMRVEDGRSLLRLIVPRADGTFSPGNMLEWSVPIAVEEGPVPDAAVDPGPVDGTTEPVGAGNEDGA